MQSRLPGVLGFICGCEKIPAIEDAIQLAQASGIHASDGAVCWELVTLYHKNHP